GRSVVWAEHKKGHVKVIELARLSPCREPVPARESPCFFCKKREESGEGYEKAPSYSFKQELSNMLKGTARSLRSDPVQSRDEVYTVQAVSEEVKTIWVTEIRKLLTGQLEACQRGKSQRGPDQFTSDTSSTNRLVKNECSNLRSGGVEKQKTEEERGKEFENILRTWNNTESQSFETKPKRQDIRSDPTPLETGPHPNLGGVRWFSTSSLFQNRRRGWSKGSLSLDASVEHDGYFSAEEHMTSDPRRRRKENRVKMSCSL
ncbi:guanine nucleotide exchange factor DBS, partial [Pimephales promelas]